VGDAEGRGLAEAFALIARELRAESGPVLTQQRVTKTAVEVVEGCDHAAISLVHRHGKVTTVAPTDEVAVLVDAIQYETGQGPCVGSISEHEVYLSDDLAVDSRWPRFSRRAAEETGVRSMLTFRLFVDDDTLGALNLYSRSVGAFDHNARGVGALLAAHAAIAMDAAQAHQHTAELDEALLSNRRIGIAMGILMVTRHLTEDQAFALLKQASQYLNVKLRNVAGAIIEAGELPSGRARPGPARSGTEPGRD
jgi:GAF domain-containing protein